MGAKVVGYSLEAPTTPNHIELLNLDIVSIIGDIRDLEKLNKTFVHIILICSMAINLSISMFVFAQMTTGKDGSTPASAPVVASSISNFS